MYLCIALHVIYYVCFAICCFCCHKFNITLLCVHLFVTFPFIGLWHATSHDKIISNYLYACIDGMRWQEKCFFFILTFGRVYNLTPTILLKSFYIYIFIYILVYIYVYIYIWCWKLAYIICLSTFETKVCANFQTNDFRAGHTKFPNKLSYFKMK